MARSPVAFISSIQLLFLVILGCQSRNALTKLDVTVQPHSAPEQPPPAVVIEMTNQLTFYPESVTIHVGQPVLWTNQSPLVHTVTLDSVLASAANVVEYPAGAEPFTSGNIRPGKEWIHTFTKAGRYRYFSIPHQIAGMTALIVVIP